MDTLALDTDQAKALGIGVILAVLVIGLVISAVVTAIVGRIITIVVVVALAAFIWSQRASIESGAKKCDATFFGVHLTPSNPTIKANCEKIANRTG